MRCPSIQNANTRFTEVGVSTTSFMSSSVVKPCSPGTICVVPLYTGKMDWFPVGFVSPHAEIIVGELLLTVLCKLQKPYLLNLERLKVKK